MLVGYLSQTDADAGIIGENPLCSNQSGRDDVVRVATTVWEPWATTLCLC